MSKKLPIDPALKMWFDAAEKFAIEKGLKWSPKDLKKKPVTDVFNHFYSLPFPSDIVYSLHHLLIQAVYDLILPFHLDIHKNMEKIRKNPRTIF